MENRKLEQDVLIDLVVDYLTGQIDEERLDMLKSRLQADPQSRRQFNEMREVWLATLQTFTDRPFDKDTAFRMFLARINREKRNMPLPRRVSYRWLVRVAAAIIIGFFGGSLSLYLYRTPPAPAAVSQIETVVPLGSKSHLTLADGTRVWLNAGSKLRYASDYGQTGREVFLEGEGYFNVAHDTTKTFVVKTNKIDIKALGTIFNVKAYPDEELIETILVEGKVSIGDIILKPHEKCVYTRKNDRLLVQKKNESQHAAPREEATAHNMPAIKIVEIPVDPVIYTSWKDSLWKIDHETLDDLVAKLERRYDVIIHFADAQVGQLSVTATIKDESLEQVLRFLQLTVPIDFSIRGKTVVLQENRYLKEKYKTHYKI
jgi:ferric-dicitrate binding protein FerR (iron transport regulator)